LTNIIFKDQNRVLALSALFAWGMLLTAYFYMELFLGLKPCILCQMQRICVAIISVIAVIGFLHKTRTHNWFMTYISLCISFGCLGSALAIRQLYLQSLPAHLAPSCGPDISYLIETLPLIDLLISAIQGDGNCAEIIWQFLGISIPGWVLISLIGLSTYLSISLKKLKTSL
jgi:disulfide bond formation protein DsbB